MGVIEAACRLDDNAAATATATVEFQDPTRPVRVHPAAVASVVCAGLVCPLTLIAELRDHTRFHKKLIEDRVLATQRVQEAPEMQGSRWMWSVEYRSVGRLDEPTVPGAGRRV